MIKHRKISSKAMTHLDHVVEVIRGRDAKMVHRVYYGLTLEAQFNINQGLTVSTCNLGLITKV